VNGRAARERRRQTRALFILPQIPDDATTRVKDAIAIRNAATVNGVCPSCHARGEFSGPDVYGLHHLTFRHEPHCGALLDEAAA
jgi:hypothetical protein